MKKLKILFPGLLFLFLYLILLFLVVGVIIWPQMLNGLFGDETISSVPPSSVSVSPGIDFIQPITATRSIQPTLQPTLLMQTETDPVEVLETEQAGPDWEQLGEYMLELINQARAQDGLQPVQRDDFSAKVGEAHAQEMVREAYLSHWNLDGLGPDLRYGLAGGTEWVQENVYSYWQRNDDGTPIPITNWNERIEAAHKGLMNSPGHRANILNPAHTHVGIGFAYDPSTSEFRIAQEFINRYVSIDHFSHKAAPGETILVNGQLYEEGKLNFNLLYESFPNPMTIEELNNSSTYSTAAQFSQYFTVNIENDTGFNVEVVLGTEPGYYHFAIWLEKNGNEFQVMDLIVEVE